MARLPGDAHRSHQTPYTQAYFDAFAAVKGLLFAKDIVDYKTSHGCESLPGHT
jgi:hypothetical protein